MAARRSSAASFKCQVSLSLPALISDTFINGRLVYCVIYLWCKLSERCSQHRSQLQGNYEFGQSPRKWFFHSPCLHDSPLMFDWASIRYCWLVMWSHKGFLGRARALSLQRKVAARFCVLMTLLSSTSDHRNTAISSLSQEPRCIRYHRMGSHSVCASALARSNRHRWGKNDSVLWK